MTREAIDAMCLQMILELVKLGETPDNAMNKANLIQAQLYRSYGIKPTGEGRGSDGR